MFVLLGAVIVLVQPVHWARACWLLKASMVQKDASTNTDMYL
jgi:hypothetical protein